MLVRVTVGGVAYTAAVFAADQGVGLLHWRLLPACGSGSSDAAGARLCSIPPARAVPCAARTLAAAPHAPCRPGHGRHDRLRFHPLEILLSLGIKAAVVVLLGAVPWAVVAFEVLLNAASVFNHGNVALPERLDRWLRWFVVTPDMHRVHHSTRVVETNATLAFRLPGGTGSVGPTGPTGARPGGHGHRPERLPHPAHARPAPALALSQQD